MFPPDQDKSDAHADQALHVGRYAEQVAPLRNDVLELLLIGLQQKAAQQSLANSDQVSTSKPTTGHVCGIAPMIANSQEAFRRDLPELLTSRYRWWVAYHGDERIGFGKTETELYKECFRHGLTEDDFVVRSIQPDAAEEIIEVEFTPWV